MQLHDIQEEAIEAFQLFQQSPINHIKLLPLSEIPLNTNEPISLDIETDDLYGKIITVQFKQLSSPYTYIAYDLENISSDENEIRHAIIDKLIGHTLIIQNVAYEMSCISTQDRCDFWTSESPTQFGNEDEPDFAEDYKLLKSAGKVRVICTLLLARLAYPRVGQGLEELYSRVLAIDVFNHLDISKKTTAKSFNRMYLSREQKIYAALDVHFLHFLYLASKSHIKSSPYLLDIKTTIVMIKRLTFSGNPVCRTTLAKEMRETSARIDERQKRLGSLNVNSPKQCKEALATEEGTGKYQLLEREIRYGDELAKDIREQRVDMKKFSLYFDFYRDEEAMVKGQHWHNDYRNNTKDFMMAYGYFSCTARSGRARSAKQNLQQLPKSLKHLYGTGIAEDNPDYVVVYADYSALELKTLMALLGPKAFMIAHDNLLDVHAYTASEFVESDRSYEEILKYNTGERWLITSPLVA